MKKFNVVLTNEQEIYVEADSYTVSKTGTAIRFYTNGELSHTFLSPQVVFIEEA